MVKKKSLFTRDRYFMVMGTIVNGPETRKNISRKLKIGASELHYHIQELLKHELINKEYNNRIKRIEFILTPKGRFAFEVYQEMMLVADKYKAIHGDII